MIINKIFEIDKRYKVTPENVKEMIRLRSKKKTLKFLSNKFKVSQATILYWTDEKQRNKQRIKNAKRKKVGETLKHSIKKDQEKRKERWSVSKYSRVLHGVYSALHETRSNRYKVNGLSLEFLSRPSVMKKLKTPNSKIKI